jgi:hypothetical protein
MAGRNGRSALFYQLGVVSGIGLGIIAAIIHLLVWLNAVPALVAVTLKILLWLFVLSCVGAIASSPENHGVGYAQNSSAYKWVVTPLLILWLIYSIVFAYYTISSPPSVVLLGRAQCTVHEKIRQLWSSSGAMLAFLSEAVFWHAARRSERDRKVTGTA